MLLIYVDDMLIVDAFKVRKSANLQSQSILGQAKLRT